MMLFVYLIVALLPALAQTAATDIDGKWFPPKPSVKNDGLTKPETEILKAKMQAFADVLFEACTPLQGFDAVGSVRIESDPRTADPLRGTVTALASVGLRRYRREAGSQEAKREKEAADHIDLVVNSIERFVPQQPYLRDQYGPVYVEPIIVERIGAHPVYRAESASGPVLVIVNRKRPAVFLPVTRQRVIQTRLAEARGLLTNLGAEPSEQTAAVIEQTKARIRSLEEELAGMQPAERLSEALIGPGQHASGLAGPEVPGARRLVMPNPAFFDKGLPKTSIHVVTIAHSAQYGDKPDLEAKWRKVDLGRVAKLMD